LERRKRREKRKAVAKRRRRLKNRSGKILDYILYLAKRERKEFGSRYLYGAGSLPRMKEDGGAQL